MFWKLSHTKPHVELESIYKRGERGEYNSRNPSFKNHIHLKQTKLLIEQRIIFHIKNELRPKSDYNAGDIILAISIQSFSC